MGWLWTSSSDGSNTPSKGSSTNADWSLSNEQKQRIFGKNPSLQSADLSRDAKADKELEALIASLSFSDSKPSESTSKTVADPSPEPQPSEQTNHDRILLDGSLNISPGALYPRTMSCRQAFDQAYYCQSLGGKFKDIYRFGALQSCSEQWGAFWFCMRTKSLSPDERERQIREHYTERDERKRKEFGSSEDVWEIRTKGVERAFQKDPDVDDGGSDHLVKE